MNSLVHYLPILVQVTLITQLINGLLQIRKVMFMWVIQMASFLPSVLIGTYINTIYFNEEIAKKMVVILA